MTRRPLTSAVLVLALAALPRPATARAEDAEANRLRDSVTDLRAQVVLLEAKQAALKVEQERPLLAHVPRPADPPAGTEVGLRDTLAKILADAPALKGGREQRERDAALGTVGRQSRGERDAAEKCWRDATGESLAFLDEVAAEEARLRLDLVTVEDRLRLRWDAHTPWLTWDGPLAQTALWAWVLTTAGVWVSTREARRELRRWWRVRGGATRFVVRVGLFCIAVAWLAGLGQIVYTLVVLRQPLVGASAGGAARYKVGESLKREEAYLRERVAKLEEENSALLTQVEKDRDIAFTAWAGGLGLPADSPLERAERKADEDMHEALVNADAAKVFADDAGALLHRLEADRKQLGPAITARQDERLTRGRIRLGLNGGLVPLAFAPPLLVLWRRRKQRRRQGEQCPRCLEKGKLAVTAADVRDERFPEPKYVFCPGCEYRLRLSQRYLPRLCFPTVGLVGSGKTHWLVEAYVQIEQQRLPTQAKLAKAPSLGDETLDELVRLLRRDYRGPRSTAATEGKFPYPITLHLQDLDRSPSRVMLNLFDFGGEMTARSIDVSVLRRRALLMDGFVFFLDPTQEVERQQAVLRQFYEDMREMRGLRREHAINVPVAICLAKLDLLPALTEFSSRAKPWLRRLRETEGKPATAALLEARSALVREALVSLFPGWPLESDLRDNFGRNFLFFPLTPVGLEEGELEGPDVTNLRNRTFAPFGIAEPVLWLLHMHGYRVLA
jgi:hypothetical protein